MQRTTRIPKRIKSTKGTKSTYVKYVNNSWLHILGIVLGGFHHNKFQVLVTPQKSECLYPGLYMTVTLHCEGLIYLLVTDISMGVEWPLSYHWKEFLGRMTYKMYVPYS